MGINAFTYTGNTCILTAGTTAPTPIQVSSSTLGGNQYRISNQSSSVGCYLSYAMDSATALANCIIPTGAGANSTKTVYIAPLTVEIITFVPNAYFTANTSTGTAVLAIVPGDGL
jgi:hypothetical protein